MKKILLPKIVVIVAAIALGSAAISTDALAQRGGHSGGGGHFGGGGAHIGGGGAHFGSGSRFGGGFSGGHFGAGGRPHGGAFAHRRFGAPYYFGGPYYNDYACSPYGYNRPWEWSYDCY